MFCDDFQRKLVLGSRDLNYELNSTDEYFALLLSEIIWDVDLPDPTVVEHICFTPSFLLFTWFFYTFSSILMWIFPPLKVSAFLLVYYTIPPELYSSTNLTLHFSPELHSTPSIGS